MDRLVDYYRRISGEHPTGTTSDAPWWTSDGSSSELTIDDVGREDVPHAVEFRGGGPVC
jgi:hypothetical protein